MKTIRYLMMAATAVAGLTLTNTASADVLASPKGRETLAAAPMVRDAALGRSGFRVAVIAGSPKASEQTLSLAKAPGTTTARTEAAVENNAPKMRDVFGGRSGLRIVPAN